MNAMLVLTRKAGEKIHIGSGITITVVEVRGAKIRLGIDAPDDVPIFRAEFNDLMARIGVEPDAPAAHELERSGDRAFHAAGASDSSEAATAGASGESLFFASSDLAICVWSLFWRYEWDIPCNGFLAAVER
jgi:carbon storage regulator